MALDSLDSSSRNYHTFSLAGFANDDTKERISWSNMKSHTIHLSAALVKNCALYPGETAALFSPNTIWYPIAMLSVCHVAEIISGAYSAYNMEEIICVLKTASAKLLMRVPVSIEIAIAAAKAAGVKKEKVFLLEGSLEGHKYVSELITIGTAWGRGGQVPPYEIPKGDTNGDLCGFLSFRRTTTGLPKVVIISHQNGIAQYFLIHQMPWESHKRVLAILPSHITGQVVRTMLNTVVNHQIEDLLLVPSILIRRVRDLIINEYISRHIMLPLSGATPVTEKRIQQLTANFLWMGFRQTYEMSESYSCIAVHPPKKYNYNFTGKAGAICASTRVEIVEKAGKEFELRGAGKLFVKGPQTAIGYLNNKKVRRSTSVSDGLSHTCDQYMANVNAIGVTPADVEDLFLGHQHEEDCAVQGFRIIIVGSSKKERRTRREWTGGRLLRMR